MPESDENDTQIHSHGIEPPTSDEAAQDAPSAAPSEHQAAQPIQPVPQPTPSQPVSESTAPNVPAAAPSVNTPGVLILQWLTYAFWGWALIALYWLTSLSVGHFVEKSETTSSYDYFDDGSMLAYSLAAVIVLFIIAIACDVFYSRFEPVLKRGAAMVIMIIHAVIFALAGIGSLIVGVFALVNMTISTGSTQAAVTTMITAGIMTIVYGATLVRTFRPKQLQKVAMMYWIFMSVVTLCMIAVGIFGPLAQAQRTKGDRTIEAGLSGVATAVNAYATTNSKLPNSLSDVNVSSSYQSESKKLIDDKLVTYTAVGKISPRRTLSSEKTWQTYLDSQDTSSTFHYKLCVEYKAEKEDSYSGPYDNSASTQYPTTPNTASHKAGNVCYDLQTAY